jgi:glycosyltransferase involved in cell wall biosynthesis
MLCSVIIPCFNDARYLPEALASVQSQTHQKLEIIVVNDGSTDKDTLALLQQLPPYIQVIHQENSGLAAARNKGIDHSNGEVIVTLDSDDRFEKTFIAKAVGVLQQQTATGVVSSWVQEFGASTKIWRAGAVDDESFLIENRIVACCAFRRQCWIDAGGYDEAMRHGLEDWDFWIRVTQKGWKVHVLKEPLFFYRKKAQSMLVSDTKPRMMELLAYMFEKHRAWYDARLQKAIAEGTLLNKKTLTLRRIAGLFLEKLTGKW